MQLHDEGYAQKVFHPDLMMFSVLELGLIEGCGDSSQCPVASKLRLIQTV